MLFILGITGSIGCGKSTVTRLFGQMGARTLDADLLARNALDPGSPALAEVTKAFGADLLTGDGPPATRRLDRSLLAQRIFSDPARRRQLEAIVHPAVFRAMAATLAEWDRSTPPDTRTIAALEIPLLLETGSAALCDGIVVVACGDHQNERLAQRPGLSETTRQQIIAQQLPEAVKCRQAHWIIDNRHDPAELSTQLLPVWATILAQKSPIQPAWPLQWRSFLNS
ncbi:MAG: dephospho-CoA kinase [Magnetococcales bacterium]|nr:dephospho-CoA kinase [Magnetococcales bacterium]